MDIRKEEILRLAHLAAHECATIAMKAHVVAQGRYARDKSIRAVYEETYNAIFAFIEKKLRSD